jgi:hypothetical protein
LSQACRIIEHGKRIIGQRRKCAVKRRLARTDVSIQELGENLAARQE